MPVAALALSALLAHASGGPGLAVPDGVALDTPTAQLDHVPGLEAELVVGCHMDGGREVGPGCWLAGDTCLAAARRLRSAELEARALREEATSGPPTWLLVAGGVLLGLAGGFALGRAAR